MRGPAVPDAGPMALVLATNVVAAVYNLRSATPGPPTPQADRDALVWAGLSALCYALVLAGLPAWARLRGGGLGLDRPRLRSWLVFLGVFTASGLVGGFARSWLAQAWAPDLLGGRSAAGLALNVVGVSLLTAIFLEFISAYRARRLASRLALQHLAAELARSRSEVVAADDWLRQELAVILHGKVQSHLVIAWAKLGQARAKRQDPAALAALLSEADACLGVVREQTLARVPAMLAPAGGSLIEALDETIARFRALMPIRWAPDPALRAEAPRLAPRSALLALRMVDEALLNAFRHARASRIEVRLARSEDGRVALTVSDDGRGFDPRSVTRGLGLSDLGRELRELGGAWELRSAPGEGTRLTIRVPAPAEAGARP